MNNQDVKIKKAFELFNNKKFEESKLIFLDLIKNQQFDKRAYYMLYEIYLQLNDNKNAKKYLISFLEFDNKNHIALNQLANLYLKKGDIILCVGTNAGTPTVDILVVSSATGAATVTVVNGS